MMAAFLSFLEKQMTEQPQDIVPVDEAQMKRVAKLVKGILVD